MKHLSEKIRKRIAEVESQLSTMIDDGLDYRPGPNEWSKKEILGHLIDSTANNHHRIVRAVYKNALDFPTYDQNEWVRIQKYNERPWSSIVILWSTYIDPLCHVIESIPREAESSPCNIGKESPVSLAFVIEDYLRHLEHHLTDIVDNKA